MANTEICTLFAPLPWLAPVALALPELVRDADAPAEPLLLPVATGRDPLCEPEPDPEATAEVVAAEETVGREANRSADWNVTQFDDAGMVGV